MQKTNSNPHSFFFILILLFSITSCVREEGCLDTGATNFSPGADKDCAECCNYPELEVRFFDVAGDENFEADSFYLDAANTSFRIENMRFFISDFKLLRADNTQAGVRDALTLQPSGEVVEDNYILTGFNTFSYEIGDVAGYGDFVGVSFNIGLDAAANAADPELMPTAHPLGIQEDTMYISASEGYIFNKIDLAVAVADTSTQSYNIIGNDQLATVSLADTFSFQKSFGVEVQIDIDYTKFFESVDFLNDSENIIIEKIVTNTSSAFSIR